MDRLRVLITGANGFIGSNLILRLKQMSNVDVVVFNRAANTREIIEELQPIDWIFHLAGVNRPTENEDYLRGNSELTHEICEAVKLSEKPVPIVFSSSIWALQATEYGSSKLEAERTLLKLKDEKSNPVHIVRLPNVFGKRSKPNYNSVVATFCHNAANDLPLEVTEGKKLLKLVYIDDVIEKFVSLMSSSSNNEDFFSITPEYKITVGELADQILRFKDIRSGAPIGDLSNGLTKALYATYLSFISPDKFKYPLELKKDPRGVFSEIIKTKNAGQVSYFTVVPGATRGGHYHNSKTEKFLVVKGNAYFKFKNVFDDEYFELSTTEGDGEVIETVPGWIHEVTNVGTGDLICVVWASENFNLASPDTIAGTIEPSD